MSQIRGWLQSCEDSHPLCKQNDRSILPRRLIDLFPSHGKGARLISSQDLSDRHPRYTALSYCWGHDQELKTVKATIDAFRSEIPNDQLPRTFADAFRITRELGIRYIWVDALCIVQDDHQDWSSEAVRMCDVYYGSFLTLIASEAHSSHGGCFVEKHSPLTERKTDERAFMTASAGQDGSNVLIHVILGEKNVAALNKRGWTLQEAILPRRTIQVTNSELHWRCRSELLWETGVKYKNGEELYGNAAGVGTVRDNDMGRLWRSWIENYSKRRFTFSKDRLPAIAGLVSFYQRLTQDSPCLGGWRKSLHKDLLWLRTGKASERSPNPPLPYSLPSWSPLSCTQMVDFTFWDGSEQKEAMAKCFTEVLHCDAFWTGEPFVSELLSSSLVVSGPVQEIYLSEATEVKDCNPPYFNVDDEEVDFATDPLPWRCAVQWDVEGQRPGTTWLCLLLEKRPPRGWEFGGETFLVLEPAEAAGTDLVYRRIGIGSLGRSRAQDVTQEQAWKFDVTNRRTITLV